MKGLFFIGMTAFAVACQAGIKHWDNPAYKSFGVGCYVPGAVWNYDGIRNAGVDQPHSTTAVTWKGKPDGMITIIR